MGTEFDEMRDYFNSPTDIWITRNLKRKIDAVLDSNGLKRNCLRNLACTGDL